MGRQELINRAVKLINSRDALRFCVAGYSDTREPERRRRITSIEHELQEVYKLLREYEPTRKTTSTPGE